MALSISTKGKPSGFPFSLQPGKVEDAAAGPRMIPLGPRLRGGDGLVTVVPTQVGRLEGRRFLKALQP